MSAYRLNKFRYLRSGSLNSPWLQWLKRVRTIPRKSETRKNLFPKLMFAATSKLYLRYLRVPRGNVVRENARLDLQRAPINWSWSLHLVPGGESCPVMEQDEIHPLRGTRGRGRGTERIWGKVAKYLK